MQRGPFFFPAAPRYPTQMGCLTLTHFHFARIGHRFQLRNPIWCAMPPAPAQRCSHPARAAGDAHKHCTPTTPHTEICCHSRRSQRLAVCSSTKVTDCTWRQRWSGGGGRVQEEGHATAAANDPLRGGVQGVFRAEKRVSNGDISGYIVPEYLPLITAAATPASDPARLRLPGPRLLVFRFWTGRNRVFRF